MKAYTVNLKVEFEDSTEVDAYNKKEAVSIARDIFVEEYGEDIVNKSDLLVVDEREIDRAEMAEKGVDCIEVNVGGTWQTFDDRQTAMEKLLEWAECCEGAERDVYVSTYFDVKNNNERSLRWV